MDKYIMVISAHTVCRESTWWETSKQLYSTVNVMARNDALASGHTVINSIYQSSVILYLCNRETYCRSLFTELHAASNSSSAKTVWRLWSCACALCQNLYLNSAGVYFYWYFDPFLQILDNFYGYNLTKPVVNKTFRTMMYKKQTAGRHSMSC